jgi:hypothetical protein
MKPKTLKSFLAQANINPALVRAVVTQEGGWESFTEHAPDVANFGIDGGSFSGFIYYTDTVAFARRHKKEILELAKEQAGEYGEPSAYVMMSSFNCFKNDDGLTADRIAEIVNSRYNADDCDFTTVFNGLAWYAGEEVARAYNYLLEQE